MQLSKRHGGGIEIGIATGYWFWSKPSCFSPYFAFAWCGSCTTPCDGRITGMLENWNVCFVWQTIEHVGQIFFKSWQLREIPKAFCLRQPESRRGCPQKKHWQNVWNLLPKLCEASVAISVWSFDLGHSPGRFFDMARSYLTQWPWPRGFWRSWVQFFRCWNQMPWASVQWQGRFWMLLGPCACYALVMRMGASLEWMDAWVSLSSNKGGKVAVKQN